MRIFSKSVYKTTGLGWIIPVSYTHLDVYKRQTLPRLADPQADKIQAQKLADSKKDQAENLMIVDLMRNDVGRVALAGSVRVPELFVVEPFPAVHHLVSTITATLPETINATDLLRACFPGGSITGAPDVYKRQHHRRCAGRKV